MSYLKNIPAIRWARLSLSYPKLQEIALEYKKKDNFLQFCRFTHAHAVEFCIEKGFPDDFIEWLLNCRPSSTINYEYTWSFLKLLKAKRFDLAFKLHILYRDNIHVLFDDVKCLPEETLKLLKSNGVPRHFL